VDTAKDDFGKLAKRAKKEFSDYNLNPVDLISEKQALSSTIDNWGKVISNQNPGAIDVYEGLRKTNQKYADDIVKMAQDTN